MFNFAMVSNAMRFFSIAEANSSDDRQRNSRRKFDEFDFAFESRLGPWLSRE